MPRRRFATIAAAAALGLALAGAVPAFADTTLPVLGSPACDDAVDNDATLSAVLLVDSPIVQTGQSDQSDTAQQAAAAALVRIQAAIKEATGRLCTTATTTEPTTTPPETTTTEPPVDTSTTDPTDTSDPGDTNTTTEPDPSNSTDPSETTTQAPSVTVSDVREEIAALNCDHFAEKQGKIQDDSFALIGHSTSQQQGALSDAYNAKLKALNYCVADNTPAPATTTVNTGDTEINNGVVVNPTQDDGSTATTSGNEVTDVPEGSAQTGAF